MTKEFALSITQTETGVFLVEVPSAIRPTFRVKFKEAEWDQEKMAFWVPRHQGTFLKNWVSVLEKNDTVNKLKEESEKAKSEIQRLVDSQKAKKASEQSAAPAPAPAQKQIPDAATIKQISFLSRLRSSDPATADCVGIPSDLSSLTKSEASRLIGMMLAEAD